MRMNSLGFVLPLLLCGVARSQQSAGFGTQPTPEIDQPPISRTTVNYVVAPVLVTDKDGNIIDGLQPAQFRLFDNGKEQNIQVDVSFEPISLVIAIEAADRVDAILKQIKHLGSMMPVLIGDQGEAAIIAFDHRIRVMQDFTSDADKVKAAIDKINAGSTSSRMIDAVDRAVYMLRKRPQNNRKIVLLVSETRDQASEGNLREALLDAQLSNVQIYSVNITQFVVRLSERPMPPRPDPIDPSVRNLPLGPSTPTTVAHVYGQGNRAQFIPVLKDLYKGVKGIFIDNPSEAFTKGTGGEEFVFVKQRGLEDAVQRISQEIHSQYLVSYKPNNGDEGGFHEIQVALNRPDYIAKTRPGYWIAGGKAQ
jgi:VWFA-related protein